MQNDHMNMAKTNVFWGVRCMTIYFDIYGNDYTGLLWDFLF